MTLTGKDESVESVIWSKNGDFLFYTRVDYDTKISKLCRIRFSAEKCFPADLKGAWTVSAADGDKKFLRYWKASSSQFLYVYDIKANKLIPIDEKGNSRKAFLVRDTSFLDQRRQ